MVLQSFVQYEKHLRLHGQHEHHWQAIWAVGPDESLHTSPRKERHIDPRVMSRPFAEMICQTHHTRLSIKEEYSLVHVDPQPSAKVPRLSRPLSLQIGKENDRRQYADMIFWELDWAHAEWGPSCSS